MFYDKRFVCVFVIHNFSLMIFITSSLLSGVACLTRAGSIDLNIQIPISKQSKRSLRINDCRPSCDYQSFLCFKVCFFKRLFAATIHVKSQQLLIQLQYVPDIAVYENRKNSENRKNRKN